MIRALSDMQGVPFMVEKTPPVEFVSLVNEIAKSLLASRYPCVSEVPICFKSDREEDAACGVLRFFICEEGKLLCVIGGFEQACLPSVNLTDVDSWYFTTLQGELDPYELEPAVERGLIRLVSDRGYGGY